MSQTAERMSRRGMVERKSQQARDLMQIAKAVAWSGLSSGLDIMGAVGSARLVAEAMGKLKKLRIVVQKEEEFVYNSL